MTKRLMTLPILVMGAGAWGTAVAAHLARRAPDGVVQLWARDAQQAQAMTHARTNEKYLPGQKLPDTLAITADLAQACGRWRDAVALHRKQHPSEALHGLVILAVPMSGLDTAAADLCRTLESPQSGEGVLWLAKGLRLASDALQWPHQMVAARCAGWPMGALSGPSFAQEVAAGLPVALTIASQDIEWARHVAQACHGGGMRMYATSDLIGVELGGAMKNVLAIAAGVCDGLKLGANARAALLTRGLAEMQRLGVALGAQPQTFLGLATLGDLVLTATGDLSRNRRVGLALAKGETLADIVCGLGHVAEGVATAPALAKLAATHAVEVPITQAVCRLIAGELSAHQAIEALMSRDPRDEHSA